MFTFCKCFSKYCDEMYQSILLLVAEEEAQESNNPEVTQLKEEKNLIEVTISGLQMEKRRIEKQQTMLQSYSESITDSHKSNAAVQLGQLLQKETIDDMMSFVDRFGEESFSIMEKLHSIDKDVKEQEEKIKMVSYSLYVLLEFISAVALVMYWASYLHAPCG